MSHRFNPPARQRGMTLWGLIYVLFTLGVIVLVVAKSLPVYMNAYDIRKTLDATASDPELQDASAAAIQSAIQRRFDAGYVNNVHGRDVAISRVSGGRELSIAYEERRPLLFNLSMVYSFDESAMLSADDGG